MKTIVPLAACSSWQNKAWSAGTVPRLSVVFPTYRRHDTLTLVLSALNAQTGISHDEFEVIVCDDASGDTTTEVLRQATTLATHPLACLVLDKQGGPARARNAAMHFVRAPVVLLLGDDILPPPDLLARHLKWHLARPAETDALLGYSTWDDNPAPNALMRWLESGGRKFAFNYSDLPTDRPLSGDVFYTCHVSFKFALFLSAGAFNENFSFASHEDLELGLRMEAKGMRLYFDPTLVARHRHWLDLSAICLRVYRMGYASIHFYQTVAQSLSCPRSLARSFLMHVFAPALIRQIVVKLAGPTDLTHSRPLRWRLLLAGMYWSGAFDAAKGRAPILPKIPA